MQVRLYREDVVHLSFQRETQKNLFNCRALEVENDLIISDLESVLRLRVPNIRKTLAVGESQKRLELLNCT